MMRGNWIIKTKNSIVINCLDLIRDRIIKQNIRQVKQGSYVWSLKDISNDTIRIETGDGRGNKKIVNVPREFKLDGAFLGLWIGDGLTSISPHRKFIKHFGFGNAEKRNLEFFIKYTARELKQDLNDIQASIHYGKLIHPKRIENLKKILGELMPNCNVSLILNDTDELNQGANGCVINLLIFNTPLSYIFTEILKKIVKILELADNHFKKKFLAGLFSAEGTADKGSNKLQWATSDISLANIIIKTLKEFGFGNLEFPPKYTRSQVKIGYHKLIRERDFNLFKKLILPFIISDTKKRESLELISGNRIREVDIVYFAFIRLKPAITKYQLARSFLIHPASASLVLARFRGMGYLRKEGIGKGPHFNPFRYFTTPPGEAWFNKNFRVFKNILDEIKRLGYFRRSFQLNKNNKLTPGLERLINTYKDSYENSPTI